MSCVFRMEIFLLLLVTLGAAICSVGICTGTPTISCHGNEGQALLSFKYGLTDPSNRLASWIEGGNCCDWYGVVCHNLTGHVLELHLRNPISDDDAEGNRAYERMALGGKINTSLLGLKHLRYLDLSNNNFGGIQVPKFFGSIWSLRYLNLSAAGFGGEVPYQLGNLTKLCYLDIGKEFRYDGYIGNLQWLSGLSMLRYLDLSYLSYVNLSKDSDRLHGAIALPLLEELHLRSCGLYHIPLLPQVNSSNLIKLDLSKNGISGSSLCMTWGFRLDSLVFLDLGDNYFDGPIPSCLSNLTSLKYLDLSRCGLNATLPSWLYKFSKLEKLVLGGNNLHGMISEDFANLTNLNYLDLSFNNNFHGKIPTSWRTMCNLQWVVLSRTRLRQKASEALNAFEGCASNSLQYLSLSDCELSGYLLNELQQFQNLKQLDLSMNSISGPILESLGTLTSLIELDVSSNQFSGTLSKNLGTLTSLIELDVSSNQFSGTLSKNLGQLLKLNYLDLSENHFSGTLSENIGQLLKLNYLDLSKNRFKGILPKSLGQLTKLNYLSVDHNSLECVLSDVFFVNLTRLSYLSASQNSITLKASSDWIPPFQLTHVYLSSWNLGPKFPKWLCSQSRLYILDISNASIEDTIPDCFWKMSSQLIKMNLSHNQLYGKVSDKISAPGVVDLSYNCFTGPLPHLSSSIIGLDLSHNSFTGPLSRLLCDETNETNRLEFLHLGNNKLWGEIPDCWNSWSYIRSLELQNNNLVGNLPSSMGLGSLSLEYLHLRNNTLSGELPSSLQNCTNLLALDLGENKLGGSIPKWIGQKLFYIEILSLRSNYFDGYIPNEMCALTSLIVLDLAHNNLSGTIPKCFSNFSAMVNLSRSEFHLTYGASGMEYDEIAILVTKTLELEYRSNLYLMAAIDLSNNSLSGWIPEGITNLIHLISLNLSRNCLTGKISKNVGNMTSLESLDLSFNQISGDIPQSMAQMTFLGFLNLSYNNLSGRIPTSTQLQSFNASSFIGNRLCGPPVSDNCSTTNRSISSRQIQDRNHYGFDEFYVSMSLGFVVGLGVVVGPLLYSRSCRFAYFLWLESIWDKLWVRAVLLKRAGFGE